MQQHYICAPRYPFVPVLNTPLPFTTFNWRSYFGREQFLGESC